MTHSCDNCAGIDPDSCMFNNSRTKRKCIVCGALDLYPRCDHREYADHAPTDGAKLIFLAGAVRHWWDENWGIPEHDRYLKWRNEVRIALIAGGYLTYAHYEAIKGTWNPRAQRINDFAIRESNLMLILTPESIPSQGTDDEIKVAEAAGVPVLRLPDTVGLARVLPMVEGALAAQERERERAAQDAQTRKNALLFYSGGR